MLRYASFCYHHMLSGMRSIYIGEKSYTNLHSLKKSTFFCCLELELASLILIILKPYHINLDQVNEVISLIFKAYHKLLVQTRMRTFKRFEGITPEHEACTSFMKEVLPNSHYLYVPNRHQ